MMPWTLKFLWSPFLEMYRTKKFFVVITQLLSGLLFGLVAFSLKFDYFLPLVFRQWQSSLSAEPRTI